MTAAHRFDSITPDELRRRPGMKWTRFPESVVPAFVAEMDFGTAPEVQAAITDAVERYAYGYLPIPLIGELGAAVSGWYERSCGWRPDPSLIFPIGDVLSGLDVVVRRFTTPGSAVVVPTPAYMPFLSMPAAELGREIIASPMLERDGRYVHDLDHLDAVLSAGAETVVLCNPHNPTGTVATADELEAFAAVIARHPRAIVFNDEIHAPIRFGAAHVPYPALGGPAAAQTITAISASKAWNVPGLKSAALILSNAQHLDRWAPIAFHAGLASSTPGVIANIAAFHAGDAWLADVLDYLDGSRLLLADLLAEHLPGARYRPPAGTYLAWIDLAAVTGLDVGDGPTPYASAFFAAGAAVTDGADCGHPGVVRLTLSTPRPILVELVRRMGAARRA